MLKPFFLIFTLTIALAALPAKSELFQNDYISFELPKNWKCKPYNTDWVCHSIHSKKTKEAMFVLTAKETASLDNLSEYEKFLAKPRTIQTRSGKTIQSKIVSPGKKIFLNNHPWVDGWFLGSEVPNYYTRYDATTCCGSAPQLAVLFTSSAHKDRYSKYSKIFMKTIKSLKVNTNLTEAIKNLRAAGGHESMGNIAAYMGELIGDGELDDEEGGGGGAFGGMDGLTLGGAALGILAPLAYLLRRAMKKKRRREREERRRRRKRSSRRRRH